MHHPLRRRPHPRQAAGPRTHQWGSLHWTNSHTGKEIASVSFRLNTITPGSESIRLLYKFADGKEELDYSVRLTHVATPWGTLRWFFICPLVRNGRTCERRVAKLYLPPHCRYYGCRRCYDLTYSSCRESHKNDAMFRTLAREVGVSFDEIRRMWNEE